MNYAMHLQILSDDPEVIDWYKGRVDEHNKKLSSQHPDAGFDLACPTAFSFYGTTKYNLDVKIAMYKLDPLVRTSIEWATASAFYLYPRSSICNTPLRLANSVGIIDSGYRGPIIACFDGTYNAEKLQRLVQVCNPTLEPMEVKLVSELTSTARGEGGFGSTGL